MTDQTPLEREAYLAHRKLLVEAEQDQARQYDRAILTLASAALGLSVTFIGTIVPEYNKATLWLLWSAWALLIASTLSILCSFQTSQTALRKERGNLDAEQLSGECSHTLDNRWAEVTISLNLASLVSFIGGASCLTIFVLLNFSK